MATPTRSERTLDSLRTALFDHLSSRPLAELSVSDLCRAAGIHRTTFYGHFQGIEEFAAAVYADTLDGLADIDFSGGGIPATTPADYSAAYLEAFRSMLELVHRDRPVYRSLFTAGGAGAFRHSLEQHLRDRVRASFDAFHSLGIREADPAGPGVAFMAAGLTAWIEAWTASDSGDVQSWADLSLDYMPCWWPRPA